MKLRAWHWLVVLPFSALAHAAVLGMMADTSQMSAAEGGENQASVAVSSASLSELFESTELEPVQPATTPIAEPVQTETPLEPVQTAEVETALANTTQTTEIPLETTTLTPVQPSVLEPIEAITLPDLAALPVPQSRPERPRPVQRQAQRTSRQQPATQSSRQTSRPAQQQSQSSSASRPAPRINRAEQRAIDNYPSVVARRVQRALRTYRTAARRSGDTGRATVQFTIRQNGSISSVRITSSSGSQTLDQAALQTVRNAAPFPPIPRHAGRSSWRFTIPLTSG